MSIFSFPCHHITSITQTSTFGYLNPPSKASGIAVALFQPVVLIILTKQIAHANMKLASREVNFIYEEYP